MSESHPYVVLDVFSDVPLEGNPVAVFTSGERIAPALMQSLARELNLSETVFLLPADGSGADARARIFTPRLELPFAGHPVLGAAFQLAEARGLEAVRLQTGAGILRVRVRGGLGEMEQPLPSWTRFADSERLLRALGVQHSQLPVEVYDNGVRHAYVELEDEESVGVLRPDFAALAELGELGVSCFCVAGARVRTRMFAPGLGVAEDPATGSAAGPLAVHLARHGRIGFGERIEIAQGVELGRPSRLLACVHGRAERLERVSVAGAAVRVAEGRFTLPGRGGVPVPHDG